MELVLHTQTAVVGVFDILGFKRMMLKSNLQRLAKEFTTLLQIARILGEQQSIFEFGGDRSSGSPTIVQASDTFVVVSDASSHADVIQFIWNVSHLVYHAIEMGFPIRGAISYGEALVCREPVVFIGPAVVEAFEHERSQEWAGACLAPSLESHFDEPGLLEGLFPLVFPYLVPMKGGSIKRYAVNWTSDAFYYMDPEHVATKFQDCPVSDPEHEDVQKKIRNTITFLRQCKKIKDSNGFFNGPENRRVVLEDIGG